MSRKEKTPMPEGIRKAVDAEVFIFLFLFLAFFCLFGMKMGLANMFNTLMNTAYELLMVSAVLMAAAMLLFFGAWYVWYFRKRSET